MKMVGEKTVAKHVGNRTKMFFEKMQKVMVIVGA